MKIISTIFTLIPNIADRDQEIRHAAFKSIKKFGKLL